MNRMFYSALSAGETTASSGGLTPAGFEILDGTSRAHRSATSQPVRIRQIG